MKIDWPLLGESVLIVGMFAYMAVAAAAIIYGVSGEVQLTQGLCLLYLIMFCVAWVAMSWIGIDWNAIIKKVE